ncbi:MAG: type II secretion system protein, partial [Candidatus Paceibacterota bacterium]
MERSTYLHITNRVRTRSLRTSYRKGFSLLELAAAIAVFGVLSGVVTLAIARAQISATEMRFERQVSGVMQSYVDQVASSSYQSIFTGDFARPAPCNYDYLSTCFSIWGRDVEVSWGTEPLADPLNKSNDGSLAVKIVASAEIKNDILEIEKVVVAPNGAWLGSDGVHRVDVSGEYDGVLYLVNQSGSTVSSGSIVNGSIFFRTSSSLCSSSNPCRVALTPEGSYLYNGYGIDAKSAVGEVGKIVILEGG